MAASMSGRDEVNPAFLLATLVHKIWKACLAHLEFSTLVPQEKKVLLATINSLVDQACSVKMAAESPMQTFLGVRHTYLPH